MLKSLFYYIPKILRFEIMKKIKSWYDGKLKTYDDPHIIGVYTERHWTSKITHIIVDFYLAH